MATSWAQRVTGCQERLLAAPGRLLSDEGQGAGVAQRCSEQHLALVQLSAVDPSPKVVGGGLRLQGGHERVAGEGEAEPCPDSGEEEGQLVSGADTARSQR